MKNFPTSLAAEVTFLRDGLAVLDPVKSQAEAIDDIRALEELKAACAAAQARRTAELEALRHEEEKARGVPKARRGNGLAAEVGLARGQSPARGTKYLTLARTLEDDMPLTKNALALGQINEERAQAVVNEVSWLAPEHRAEVDELMAGKFEGLGPRKLAGKVRAHAERLDLHGAVARNEIAHSERRVTVRPAAYGMAYVTALVSTQQAVGILATLTRDANSVINSGETADPTDPTGQPRTHGQVMADLFVQRVNGQTSPQAVPAEVLVVMTDETLFGDGDTPAWITGHGPVPAELAKRWIANPQAEMTLRRSLPGPKITNWWPRSHGPAASQRFYGGWLSCEMTPVGHRFVMRRSKRLIMLFQCMKVVPRVGKTLPGSALPVIKLKRILVGHTRQHQNGYR